MSLDGIDGNYEHGKPAKRTRYLNEAFWPHQQAAENFRMWLLSEAASGFRRRWFDGISNHTVLRYVDYGTHDPVGEEEKKTVRVRGSAARPPAASPCSARASLRTPSRPHPPLDDS